MFCENCGKIIPDGAMFCPDCGNRLKEKPKHRLTRAHREKQLKMSCQALHNAPPNRT